MTDLKDFLREVPFFAGLCTDDLECLARHVRTEQFSKRDAIIHEGDTDGRLYVIISGLVHVVKDRGKRTERFLAALGPRDYFGEMSLIDNCPRSATVVAREETQVLSIDQLDLKEEIEKAPSIAWELLTTLTKRMRALEKSFMKNLGGLLPICMNCKNIRTEDSSWVRIDEYIANHSDAEFTHGICPDCMKKLYPHHFENGHR
jgi:CRP-like cAMP-binding protein